VGALLIAGAALTALLVAAALRTPSLVTALLAAYLGFVANLGAVTWALSPFHAVTRVGLATIEGALLALALAVWDRRGRPSLPLRAAVPTVRAVFTDPVSALFLATVGALLAYELVLVLTVPPDNWDALTYHLARVAAWMHHGGIYRIPNAPSANLNDFPPLAEQQILYFFVAVGSSALFGLPQYLAQIAILVAVYGCARRLGFGPRPAAASACVFATFSFVLLQATTAQNDLFAASFPVVAACLFLGSSRTELALGGMSTALGLGAKPTTALALPVLACLVLLRARRALLPALAGAAIGLLAVSVWPYTLNAIHTGHIFGEGGWTNIGAPGQQSIRPGALSSAVDIVYQLMDVAPLSDRLIGALAIAGLVTAAVVLAVRRRPLEAVLVAVPFLAPLLVIGNGDVIAYLSRSWGFPVRGRLGNVGGIARAIDVSAFGPIGAVLLLAAPIAALAVYVRRRDDPRRIVFAAALPVFLLLLAQTKYNWYLTRFLLIPAALTAPLFAIFLRSRVVVAAFLVVGATIAAMVVTQDPSRPLGGRLGFGSPWNLTQAQAAYLTDEAGVGDAVTALDRDVPAHACLGAVLGAGEPAFFLSGPRVQRDVIYLPVSSALNDAYNRLLSYVVISTGKNRWAAGRFRDGGWQVKPLGRYWLLAVAPHAADGICHG